MLGTLRARLANATPSNAVGREPGRRWRWPPRKTTALTQRFTLGSRPHPEVLVHLLVMVGGSPLRSTVACHR
jgi:hypothetical protein